MVKRFFFSYALNCSSPACRSLCKNAVHHRCGDGPERVGGAERSTTIVLYHERASAIHSQQMAFRSTE